MKKVIGRLIAAGLAVAAAVAAAEDDAAADAAGGRAVVSAEARALWDNVVAALGGRERMAKVERFRMVIEATVEGQAIGITLTSLVDGRKVLIKNAIGAVEMVQGYDGEVAWSQDMVFGLRRLEGGEKEALVVSCGEAGWAPERFFARIERDGAPAEFAGRKALVVRMTGREGYRQTVYVCPESFMPLGLETRQQTVQGEVTGRVEYTAFAESASGVKYPSRLTIRTGPMTLQARVTEYAENVPLAPSLFVMPKE